MGERSTAVSICDTLPVDVNSKMQHILCNVFAQGLRHRRNPLHYCKIANLRDVRGVFTMLIPAGEMSDFE